MAPKRKSISTTPTGKRNGSGQGYSTRVPRIRKSMSSRISRTQQRRQSWSAVPRQRRSELHRKAEVKVNMSAAGAWQWMISPTHWVAQLEPKLIFDRASRSTTRFKKNGRFCIKSSMVDDLSRESRLVRDAVLKKVELGKRQLEFSNTDMQEKPGYLTLLSEAYDHCGKICANASQTNYLGTMLLKPERRRAIWAIYAWCSRTDELVDGPDVLQINSMALDTWEARLEDIFRGQPLDMIDAALSDTVSKFPISIQPFKDMIVGMKMDLWKSRYKTFDELYLYSYHVAGTVALMTMPVMDILSDSVANTEKVYCAALTFSIANQLTNILRDVGQDARHGRIYLPQDELALAGLSEVDIFAGKVTDKWRDFMKKQITRARRLYDEAEKGIMELNSASRWPVWVSLILSRKILDEIEANDYNNFKNAASVSKTKKILALPLAYAKTLMQSSYENYKGLI